MPPTSPGPASARTAPDPGALPPVDSLGYEEARDELVSVVARLEAGGETLEGSLALWERGEALAARCREWLDNARARLDAARPGADGSGSPGARPTSQDADALEGDEP